jgi:DNA-binding transcriptional ArsR family regulator
MDEQPTAPLLRQYLHALSDATRADILLEIEEAGEITATQLGARLGLTVGNVYHHLRVLHRLGVLDAPRVVPGPTYVEKYQRLHPELARLRDPGWLDRVQETMSPAERQAVWVAMCAHAGHLMIRAATRFAALDPDDYERLVYGPAMGMVSIQTLPTAWYEENLARARTIANRDASEASPGGPRHLMILTFLPHLFEPRGHGPHQG